MAARDVHDWIDRWRRTGLVDDALADRLHDDATRAGVAVPLEAPTVDRALSVARAGVVEALGYVGAALTVGASIVLLDVPQWPDLVLASLLVLATVVALVGQARLSPATTPASGRLAGVLGAVAVVTAAGAMVQAFPPDPVGDAPGRLLVPALPAVAVGVVAYRRHHHVLTHAALGVAVVASCVGVGGLLVPDVDRFAEADAVAGILLLAGAVAWAWASETGRLVPPWLGTLAAGGVAYAGVAMAARWPSR